jgi:gamma-polyglutamate biosynthesis protein CapA
MRKHEPIRLIAVGDICPGDLVCLGFGTGTLMRSRGPYFALERARALLREGDVVLGNLEGVLSNHGADPSNIDSMEFRGVPEFAHALRDAGFNVMTVANNHVGDYGPEGIADTVNNLKSAGVHVLGLRDKNRTATPLIQEIKGLRIGWLSYTWHFSRNRAQDTELLSLTKGHEVPAEIAALRREVDFLIVTPHWGAELVSLPPQSVFKHAHAMADAGADLILGHHPHVLQGMERRGKCLIVYSLGDFLFDDWLPWLTETALFRCTIEEGEVRNPEFVPLKINRNFQPQPATKAQSRRILRRIERSTRAINDPKLAWLRDETRTWKREAKMKRRLVASQILFLAANIGRLGPRFAYQKLARRLPVLPSWPKKQQAQ